MNTLNTYVIAHQAAVECRIGYYLRNTVVLKTLSRRSTESFEMIGAAPSVAEAIGTQSVKVLLVHMRLCLVGTYESMFSCMNMSVF